MKKNLKYVGIVLIIAVIAIIVGVFVMVKSNQEKEEQQLAHRLEGITYFEQEEYEKALECFQDALSQSKGKIDAIEMDICFYKAETLYKLGNTDEALETYNSIIDYNENAQAYFLRGNLYYSLGEEAKALADYEKAVENETKDYDLYIGIYEILASRNRVEEGKVYLNKALEIKGNKNADKVIKGRINYLLGDNETAIQLLEEVSEKEPESCYYLFLIYDSMENSEKAMEYLNTYLKEEKDLDSDQLYEIGASFFKQEQYDSAIEFFNKALELEKVPNKQIIMKKLVAAYEKIEDFTSAKNIMKAYVEEYPEDEEALREWTFLETR